MKNGYIICVDDEKIILDSLQSHLNRNFGMDHHVEISESGSEALELVDELLKSGNEILVVITDQLMPGMKGHELLKNIYASSPSSYNILLTGHSDIDAVTEAVNHANLYRYISKPWERNDLILTVKEAIKGFFQDKQLKEQNRLLERHNKELEILVQERTYELRIEKEKSDELLLNILPVAVATELKQKGEATPRLYKMATALFTDFKSFTKSASAISPLELIQTLNECFTAFDEIIGKFGMEKIKTIGDAYMCVGGIPEENTTNSIDAVNAAVEINNWVNNWNTNREKRGLPKWEIRIGVHTGALIAGVIGKKKFAYDVWGDAVNIASRMESSGESGKINISSETYELVKDYFECEFRGQIEVKNRGEIGMYFVDGIL
jgi:class 3 adenylate cyclase